MTSYYVIKHNKSYLRCITAHTLDFNKNRAYALWFKDKHTAKCVLAWLSDRYIYDMVIVRVAVK